MIKTIGIKQFDDRVDLLEYNLTLNIEFVNEVKVTIRLQCCTIKVVWYHL